MLELLYSFLSNEKQSWTNVTKWAMLAEKNSSNYTACMWNRAVRNKNER